MVNVLPITQAVLRRDEPGTHCVSGPLLGTDILDPTTLVPHRPGNHPRFLPFGSLMGRVGIFSATEGAVTRSFILLLPAQGQAERVLVCVPPAIGQASNYYLPLDGRNPISVPLIWDAVALVTGVPRDGKAQPIYGMQVLTAGRPRALLMPVRVLAARDQELGPFLDDARLLASAIQGIATACGQGFNPNDIEVFTHSNGIQDCNRLIMACVRAGLRLRHGIALDPFGAQRLATSPGMEVRQYLSGQTGGIVNNRPVGNFTYLPYDRWEHEPHRARVMRSFHNSIYDYLHNYAFPKYLLRLALTSLPN